jgi:hypothetical protein
MKSQIVCVVTSYRLENIGVSEESSACFFGGKQSNNTLLGLLEPEGRDIKFLRNVGNYLSALNT